MGWVAKTNVDVTTCEIARLLKLTATAVEPISFNVPRKSDIFQDDLYPPTYSGEASLNAGEWFSGKTPSAPKMVSLAPGYTPVKKTDTEFKTVQVESKQLSQTELQSENAKQKQRIAYLEAELAKRDPKIKELGGSA